MDQGGYGRGTLHRIGQPDIQRYLRAFAAGADKEAQGCPKQKIMSRLDRHRRSCVKNLLESHGTKMDEDEHHSQNKARIADAIHDKSFFTGIARALLVEIKSDEQIGAEPDPFPAHEHHHVVVGQNERQHGEHEEVHIGKESIVSAVIPHVSG